MAYFVRAQSINKEIETALDGILQREEAVARLNDQKQALDEESQKIFDDRQRLRENMKALKGSAEEKTLLQCYTKQLNAQETLESLEKETKELEARQQAAQADLDRAIKDLSFDVTL